MGKSLRLLISISALILVSCATTSFKINGVWHLSSPGGTSEFVEISPVTENKYYLKTSGLPIDGLYRLEGELLILEKPNDARLKGYVWQSKGDTFSLIEEPSVRLTNLRLLGSSLVKQ